MTFRAYFSSSASPFTRFARGVRSAWPHAMHAILPNACALCGNLSHSTLCLFCDESYWNESALRCCVCAVPLTFARREQHASYRCADCVAEKPPFDATFALADYRAPLDALAVGLKFRAQLMLAREFSRRLAHLAQDTWQERSDCPDVIAPVPLADRRLRERGYNQAWQIARALARSLKVPADPTLVRRVIDTAPQSRLDLDARRLNVGRAFQLAGKVEGLHVGIVDDVMTTGATLEALARTLKAAGARRVTNFVALRTPKN
ncbi:ComF family protein [Paraburkholderia strydomiana]|uniref:ComF family protein n=1 Tax=Paraburkholderia strydomiana TaxID=1245417 RepID=UPI0038BD3853